MKNLVSVLILGLLAMLSLQACTPDSPPEQTATARVVAAQWQSDRPIKEPIKATISPDQAVTAGDLMTQQVKVSIPPGMLSAGTVVTLANPEDAPPMIGSRGTPLGAPVKIAAGDRPTRLNEFMSITLKFDPGRVSSADRGNLSAAFYNEETRQWEYITPDRVDLGAGTIEFTTDHLSIYGAGVVELEERIAKEAHSRALAELATEQIFDKVADRVVDHILKEQLGLMEYTTKSKVLSGLLKDKEYAKITRKFSSGDSEGAMKDLTIFTGKKLVEVVESKILSASLMEAAKSRRFGAGAYQELRNKLMEGAGETMATRSLKEMVGAGTAGKWGLDVDVISEASGLLYEGNVREATRIMGEKVADSFVIGKIGRVATELIRHQINSIQNAKLEDAYQAWKTGTSGHGYTGDKGDFAGIWGEMKGGLQRQLLMDARAAENEIRLAGGQPPLVPGGPEDRAFEARVTRELEAQWKARAGQEAREARIKDELNKLLNDPEMQILMDSTAFFASGMTERQKWDSIMKARDRILMDTAGEILKNKQGNVVRLTIRDIVALIRVQRGAATPAEGWKAYYALLEDKFSIDPTAVTAPPPAEATPASNELGDLQNTRSLVVKGFWKPLAETTSYLGPSRVGEPINILPDGKTSPSAPIDFSFDSGSIPIAWNGASFSGKLESRREGRVNLSAITETVSGSVAADGSISLQYSAQTTITAPKIPGQAETVSEQLVLKNVPLTATQDNLPGASLSNVISNHSRVIKRTQGGALWEEERVHTPITMDTSSYLRLFFDY